MFDETKGADPFLRRLAGGIAAGLALLVLGYGLYLWEVRIPSVHRMVMDFNSPIPMVTRWVFRAPAMPLSLALGAFVIASAACIAPKPRTLIAAWIAAMISAGATVGVELALAYPLTQLVNSISGNP